jgi:hypothetical protein
MIRASIVTPPNLIRSGSELPGPPKDGLAFAFSLSSAMQMAAVGRGCLVPEGRITTPVLTEATLTEATSNSSFLSCALAQSPTVSSIEHMRRFTQAPPLVRCPLDESIFRNGGWLKVHPPIMLGYLDTGAPQWMIESLKTVRTPIALPNNIALRACGRLTSTLLNGPEPAQRYRLQSLNSFFPAEYNNPLWSTWRP